MIRRMALLCVVACGGGTGGPDANPPDANPPIDAPSATPDANACAHVLFLNFDGDTIVLGTDDAPTDHSSIAAGTIPAFRATDPNRATTIASFTTQIADRLTAFGVDVVTARPASGDYDMIVYGGDPSNLGMQQGLQAIIDSSGCTGPIHNAVGFVFDDGSTDIQMANYAVAEYGTSFDVPMSTQVGDCMCFAAAGCGAGTSACLIGGANTPRDPEGGSCGTGTTFDEAAAFTSALTCP